MAQLDDHQPYSPLLRSRAVRVHQAFLASLHLAGDIAELGVHAGLTSRRFVAHLEHVGIEKMAYLFDSFEGLPDIRTPDEHMLGHASELVPGAFSSSLGALMHTLDGFRQYSVRPGLFSDTLPAFDSPLCFMHVDADLYQSTVEAIGLADRCLVPQGVIVFDDYGDPLFPGVKLAVDNCLDPQRYSIEIARGITQCVAVKRP